MVIERKIVIGLGDIRAVIFECTECHGRLAVPADRLIHGDKMTQCTYCGKAWLDNYTKASPYLGILEAVQKVKQLEEAGVVPFHTRLEFDEPLS